MSTRVYYSAFRVLMGNYGVTVADGEDCLILRVYKMVCVREQMSDSASNATLDGCKRNLGWV